MVQNALGLIETVGLIAAVEAADAAVKAANIKLIGYELTRGGGMVVVKLSGDVGAVKAAVEAGRLAAGQVGRVWATHIIPRPHHETAGVVYTRETVRANGNGEAAAQAAAPAAGGSAPGTTAAAVTAGDEQASNTAVQPPVNNEQPGVSLEVQAKEAGQTAAVPVKKSGEVCNLCGDPACSRKKGDPKATCLHYDKILKEDE